MGQENQDDQNLTNNEKEELSDSLGSGIEPEPMSDDEQKELQAMAMGDQPAEEPKSAEKPAEIGEPEPEPVQIDKPEPAQEEAPAEKPPAPAEPEPKSESEAQPEPTKEEGPADMDIGGQPEEEEDRPKPWLPKPVKTTPRMSETQEEVGAPAEKVGKADVSGKPAPAPKTPTAQPKRSLVSYLKYGLLGLVGILVIFTGLAYVDAKGWVPLGINNFCRDLGMTNGCLSFVSGGMSPVESLTKIRENFQATTSHSYEAQFSIAIPTGATSQTTSQSASQSEGTTQSDSNDSDNQDREALEEQAAASQDQSTTEATEETATETTANVETMTVTGTATGISSPDGAEAEIAISSQSESGTLWQEFAANPIKIHQKGTMNMSSASLKFNGWVGIAETDFLTNLDFLTITSGGLSNVQTEAVNSDLTKYTLTIDPGGLTIDSLGQATALTVVVYAGSDYLPQEVDLSGQFQYGSIELAKKYASYNSATLTGQAEVTPSRTLTLSDLKKLIVSLNQTAKQRDSQRKEDLAQIQSAIESYKSDKGKYPKSAGLDKIDRPDSEVAQLLVPDYISEIPKDPLTDRSFYGYLSEDGSTYSLSAVLEVKSDPEGKKTPKGIFLYFLRSP